MYCVAHFLLWLDEEEINYTEMFSIRLIEINSELLESLKLDRSRMEQTLNTIEKFFYGNEIDAAREICVLSEFIAQKLIEKIERKKVSEMNFRNIVNKLCNIGSKKEEKEKFRYNYSYLGSMLYPIYYLRNELQHGTEKNLNIEINKNHTQIIFNLFIEILNYLAKKQISLLH